jgi:hypothetical protein
MNMRRTTPTALCLLALALLPAAATRAETKGAPPAAPPKASSETGPYFTHYKIRYLRLHAAEVLAWQQCPPDAGESCRVMPDEHGEINVIADAATQRKIAQVLAKEDSAPLTQTFQIVLLLADDQPGDPPALAQGARKAVDDLRGFLPYKGYHLLDTALLRSTDHTEGRLTGRDGISYHLNLAFDATGVPDNQQLYVKSLHFGEEGLPAALRSQRPSRPLLLSTSFGLKVGETVVVGTSKLDGGNALVLLVTALPPA